VLPVRFATGAKRLVFTDHHGLKSPLRLAEEISSVKEGCSGFVHFLKWFVLS
jgi:hypothetical protein